MKKAAAIAWASMMFAACQGEGHSPQARVVALSAPENDDDARRAGCFSSGARAGAGFGELMRAAGELQLEMILEASEYDGPRSTFALRFLPGEGELGEMTIAEDFWTEGYADRLPLPAVTLFDDYGFVPILDGAIFSGKIYVDPDTGGMTVNAVLTGYFPRDRLRAEADAFEAACASGAAPAACAKAELVLGAAPATESIEALLLELSGGYDAKLETGDALSTCFSLSAEPINLQ